MAKNFENLTTVAHTQGQLRCATAEEYYYWLTGKPQHVGARTVILNPRRTFCLEARPSWCQHQRRRGLCHLTPEQFRGSIKLRHAVTERMERGEYRSAADESAT